MKKSDFSKCHGWKIIVIIIMLGISVFWFINTFTDNYSFIQSDLRAVEFWAHLAVVFLMLIPPVILIVNVIRHRNDEFKSYGSAASDAAVAVVKIIGFTVLYLIVYGLMLYAATFFSPLLFTKG